MVPPTPNPFGTLLRDARRRADRTLEEVAAVLEVSIAYLSDVERGNRPPFTRERLLKLAEFLNVSIVRLIVAAAQQRGIFTMPIPPNPSLAEKTVLSGLARGGITPEQWEEMAKILGEEHLSE